MPCSNRITAARFAGRASATNGDAPKFQCAGVRLLQLPLIPDARGDLMFAEFPKHLPFVPKRFFVTYDVPPGSVRGEHAHKRLEQIAVCLRGSFVFTVDDGTVREDCVLDSPGAGLYVPPLVWGVQSQHSPDCMMLVLASDVYDESGYLRNYEDFLTHAKAAGHATSEDQP
ncbi:MAG: FdtA/QdtA family cupin domain-containing protein [Chthoniobacteraceae bacterium]